MLLYRNRADSLAVLHPVVGGKHLHRKNLLHRRILPFALSVDSGEGHIAAYHQKRAALQHIIADQVAAVGHHLASGKGGSRKQQGVGADIGKHQKVILLQLFHLKGELLHCQMVGKERKIIAALFQRRL